MMSRDPLSPVSYFCISEFSSARTYFLVSNLPFSLRAAAPQVLISQIFTATLRGIKAEFKAMSYPGNTSPSWAYLLITDPRNSDTGFRFDAKAVSEIDADLCTNRRKTITMLAERASLDLWGSKCCKSRGALKLLTDASLIPSFKVESNSDSPYIHTL